VPDPASRRIRPGMVGAYNLHCMVSMTFDLGTASNTMSSNRRLLLG
jgi:hypothetical protein